MERKADKKLWRGAPEHVTKGLSLAINDEEVKMKTKEMTLHLKRAREDKSLGHLYLEKYLPASEFTILAALKSYN